MTLTSSAGRTRLLPNMGGTSMTISEIANEAPNTVKKGPDCTVCQALAELPPKDAAGLRAMLADPKWRYTLIAERIKNDKDTPEWVRAIKHQTYARHAKGGCDAGERLRRARGEQ